MPEKQFGEYRTRRLVLEAWDRLEDELGPAVLRNYWEEMEASGRVSKADASYNVAVESAPVRPQFGASPTATTAAKDTPHSQSPANTSQPDLFGSATTHAVPSAQLESVRHAPHPELPAQPVLIPSPPQGPRMQRLSRLLTIAKQRTPEAIGEMVAALSDEDEQLRWLAGLSLSSIGGAMVVATLQAFVDQAPSPVAHAEAIRLLEQITGEAE